MNGKKPHKTVLQCAPVSHSAGDGKMKHSSSVLCYNISDDRS